MLDHRPIFRSEGLTITDVRCACGRDDWSTEESVDATRLVLVRRGVFEHRWRGVATVAEPNRLIWFHGHEPYRIRHPVDGGDRCTSIAIDAQQLAELAAEVGVELSSLEELADATVESALDAAHRELALLAARRFDDLDLEESCTELVRRAISTTASQSSAPPTNSTGPSGERRKTAERARLALAERLDRCLTLRDLASAAGCSPSHLCRIFRRETGLSIGAYRTRLRIRCALDRLTEGEEDLTTLALDLGFFDHAHFARTFRREVGVPPSRWRQRFS